MRVLVTGVAGSLGRLVAERLLDDPAVESVIGLDARTCHPPLPGLHFVRAALRQPEWTPLLNDVDAMIHLAGAEWPTRRQRKDVDWVTVEGTKHFFHAVRRAGIGKLIVGNSGAIYGPQPAGLVPETALLHGHQAGGYARVRALIADYLSVMAEAVPAMILTRLHTAWVCGPRHLAVIRAFSPGRMLARGLEDRPFQVVHEEDLVTAFALALHQDLPGVYNCGANGGIPFREIAVLMGDQRGAVPLAWILARSWWRWRIRRMRGSPSWISALYHTRPLDTRKLCAAGWSPQFSTRETLVEALAAFQAGT